MSTEQMRRALEQLEAEEAARKSASSEPPASEPELSSDTGATLASSNQDSEPSRHKQS